MPALKTSIDPSLVPPWPGIDLSGQFASMVEYFRPWITGLPAALSQGIITTETAAFFLLEIGPGLILPAAPRRTKGVRDF